MSIETEAVYENGTLKLDHALPLEEHQRVKIVIETKTTVTRRNYGVIGWTGDAETVRTFALQPEHGVSESP
jgi:predicted DNA-binding antitoxin AbrB/MazE fold protein